MKKVLILIFLLTLITDVYSQYKNRLLGKWQADNAEINSMYFDSYEFYRDGRFVFKPNEYNGLNRIISINGKYRLTGDTLIMITTFTKEIVGGFLIRSESTTLSDTWEIIGGKGKKIMALKKTKQSGVIKFGSNKKEFILDGRKFFNITVAN